MTTAVVRWSVEDVARWLSRQPVEGVESIAGRFREEDVDGKAMLSYVAPDRPRRDLKDDFGLSIGKANALWEAIRELSNAGAAEDGTISGRRAATPTSMSSGRSSSISEPDAGSGSLSTEEGIPPRSYSGPRTPPTETRSLRLAPASASPRAEVSGGSFAAELSPKMRVKELKTRAVAAGVSEQDLDDAEDEEDHKGALVRLIVAKETARGDHRQEALREELRGMRIKGLKEREQAVGVSAQQLDDAEDEDDDEASCCSGRDGRTACECGR